MISECIMLGMLAVLAEIDVRKKELPLVMLIIFCGIGVLVQGVLKNFLWKDLCGGILVGVGILLAAVVSRENIGIGDGLLLCVTGLYLGLWRNLVLLLGAFTCAAAVSVVLLFLKKCDRRSRFPFVPFILVSYVGLMVFTG